MVLLDIKFSDKDCIIAYKSRYGYGHALFSRLRKTKYSHLDSSCTLPDLNDSRTASPFKGMLQGYTCIEK